MRSLEEIYIPNVKEIGDNFLTQNNCLKEFDDHIESILESLKDELGGHRLPGWYSIRFRMDGCNYEPCNIVFWRHYDNLQQYESNKTKIKKKIQKHIMEQNG